MAISDWEYTPTPSASLQLLVLSDRIFLCRSAPAAKDYSPTPSASSSQSPSPPRVSRAAAPARKAPDVPAASKKDLPAPGAKLTAQGAPAESPLLVSGLPSYLTEEKVSRSIQDFNLDK